MCSCLFNIFILMKTITLDVGIFSERNDGKQQLFLNSSIINLIIQLEKYYSRLILLMIKYLSSYNLNNNTEK